MIKDKGGCGPVGKQEFGQKQGDQLRAFQGLEALPRERPRTGSRAIAGLKPAGAKDEG